MQTKLLVDMVRVMTEQVPPTKEITIFDTVIPRFALRVRPPTAPGRPWPSMFFIRYVGPDGTLCTAVDLYRRLAMQLAEQIEGLPAAELIQHLRSVGAEVGRASKVLGLYPSERVRIGLAAKTEQPPAGAWGSLQAFPAVIDGGKAA